MQAKNNYCTLYLVRHGQTDLNANGIVQGQTDAPLNSEGIKQAEALRQDLKDIKFDAVFSSSLIRAKKTAEIIVLERKMAVEINHLLRERYFGKFDGKPERLMKKYFAQWKNLSKKERASYKPYKGYETDEELAIRLITFLRETAVSYPGKTVLVVCHGGIMRALLNHLSEKTYFAGCISNSGLIKLESDGVDFFIKELKGIQDLDAK